MVSVPRFMVLLPFASLLLFSCGKAEQTISEVNIVEHGTGLARVFNASSPESKVLIDNSHNLLWEDTDRIWLDGNEFTLLSRDGSRATFGGEVSVEKEHYVSFFPYCSSFEGDDYELHFPAIAELPSVQYAKENGCPWPLSYAVSDEDKLHFRHLDATLQFTLADDMTGLSRVHFHGNNSEAVCGKVNLYFSADYSSISSKCIENDGGEIVLEGPFEAGKTYLFNLLPANFSSGITLEFAFDDGTSGCLSKNTSLELSAGTWVNLSNSISKSSLSECTGGIADISQWRAFKAANETGGGYIYPYCRAGRVTLSGDIDGVTNDDIIPTLSRPLDGNGHTITLDILSSKRYCGLIGQLYSDVCNLNLAGRIRYKGNSAVGALAGVVSDVNIEDVDSSVDIRVFSTETNSSILAGGLAGTTNTADGTVFFKDCAVSGNLTSIQYLHSLGGIIAHGGNGSAPHVVIDGCTYSGTIEYGQGNIPADGSGKPLTAGRIGGLIGDVSRIVTIRNSSTLAGTAINVRLNGWTLGNGGIGGLAGRSTSNKDGYTMQLTFEGSCTNNADITVFDMLSEERDWCNQVLGRQGKAPAGSGVASGSCSYASSSVPGAMVGSFRLCQLTGRRTSSMTNLSGISKTVGTNEMAYVLVTSGGKVIVIDGGYPENLPTLRDIINSNGGHVDLWFVSHPHEDHYSALLSLLDDMNGITIGKIVYSRVEAWSSELYDKLDASHSGVDEIVDVQMPGQRFDIDNIGIKVLSVAERYLDSNQNNSSMVLRVWDSGKVVVFLGDAGVPLGRKLLSDCKADLDCDYLQIAHHGNKGCEEFFYRNVRFDYALVPTADWIWHAELYNASMPDNLDGGITRSWIEDILPSANIITSYEHPDWWLEPVGSFVMDGYVEGGLIDYFN